MPTKVRGLLETPMILNSSCILEPSGAACNLIMLSFAPDQMNLYLWAWGLDSYIVFKAL